MRDAKNETRLYVVRFKSLTRALPPIEYRGNSQKSYISAGCKALSHPTHLLSHNSFERMHPPLRCPPLYSWLLFVGTASYWCITTRRRKKEEEEEEEKPLVDKDAIYRKRRQFCSNTLRLSYATSSPLLILRGHGTYLYDERNVPYLDTRNNVAHVGHAHPRWVAAVTDQVALLNTNTRYLHPGMCALAERLLQTFPTPTSSSTAMQEQPMTKVFFCNSGSEANDLALRLTRAYFRNEHSHSETCKIPILVLDHAYHGHTMATVDVSPYKFHHSAEYRSAPSDTSGPPSFHHGDFHVYPLPHWDIAAAHAACRDAVETYGRIGALFLESGGLSVAGVVFPPSAYVAALVAAVRAAGGLYIADEVQTGLGRCGSSFWGFVRDNPLLLPDIVTIGKGFGNGLPLAAVVTNDRVNDAFEKCGVEYFNTFGGNPVAAVAGLAVLDILRDERLQENALTVGTFLREELEKLAPRTGGAIGEVRGSGLFLGVVFQEADGQPATRMASWLCTHLKEQYHILTSLDGPDDNVMVIKPPMVFSIIDAKHFLKCLEQALVHDLPLQSLNSDDAFIVTPT